MNRIAFLEKLLDDSTAKWLPLGDVAEYSKTRVAAAELDAATFVGVDNLLADKGGRTDASRLPNTPRVTAFEHGDILIGNIRPYLKKIWRATTSGGCSGDVLAIRIQEGWKKTLSSEFLYYLISSDDFFAYNMRHAKGAKMPRGNKASIMGYLIPIPCPENPKKSLAIQAEIVRILNAFTKLTAELHAELNAELNARTKQYDYHRNELLTFEEPEVAWRPLVEIADFQNAKPHEKLVSPDGDVALLTSGFISNSGKTIRRVPSQDVLTPALRNDVALVMSDLPNGRALAKSFFVDDDNKYAANQRVCLLRTKDAEVCTPRFLHCVMNRNPQLLAFDNGMDQTHLKKAWILNVQIPLPSIAEQTRIVAILDKLDALAHSISEGLSREIELRQKQYVFYRDALLNFPKPEPQQEGIA